MLKFHLFQLCITTPKLQGLSASFYSYCTSCSKCCNLIGWRGVPKRDMSVHGFVIFLQYSDILSLYLAYPWQRRHSFSSDVATNYGSCVTVWHTVHTESLHWSRTLPFMRNRDCIRLRGILCTCTYESSHTNIVYGLMYMYSVYLNELCGACMCACWLVTMYMFMLLQ